MAEKIISPGVFTDEIDQSFLPAAIAEVGAVIVGPTVKGPAGIPTKVESYADFVAKFGDSFESGSVDGSDVQSYQYWTSHAAREYLKVYGALVGKKPLIFTNNDSAYETAIEFKKNGIFKQLLG